MKKHIFQRDWLLPAAIFVICLIVAGGVIVYKNLHREQAVQQSSISGGFTYDCDESKPDSIECLQKKYVQSMREKEIKETFTELRSDYASSTAVQSNCHQITHAIGREAAEQFKTIEAAYERGDNFCWSGFYHGVMEAIAKDYGREEINESLTSVCANIAATRQYSFYHYNCVHGLGHGLMAVNEDELFDVLKLCDSYSDIWEQRSCYGGAYMENIMIAIQMGGQSKYLKNDEPMYPCTAVDDKYKTECYLMQTSQALRAIGNDYSKVFQLCTDAGDYRDECFQSLGRDASGNTTSSIEQTRSICMLGQNREAQENCFIGAVKDFISYHHGGTEASALCSSLEDSLQPVCNQTREEYIKTL